MGDLDKYCRLCLTTDSVNSPLFENSYGNGNIPLYQKVMRCVSTKIRVGDGLPSFLCQSCCERVNSILCFKEACEHTDISLRRLLKDNRRSDQNELEGQILSIAQESKVISSAPFYSKKKSTLTSSKGLCRVKDEKEDCSTQALLKVETVFNTEDEADGWADSHSSPASASSPASPLSPLSLHHRTEDDDLSLGSKRKSRNEKRKREYVCEFCGKKFPRSNHLTQHELTHTAEKPFHCSDCNKSFWYKASLIGHIKQTHTGDVNYTCEFCGKGFFKKTELTRHKPTHSNETPHKCPQCGMGFKITKTLKRHIRNVHAAQRSHTCHTCGKSFTQLQTLKVHLILHSGVKPYVCSYCGKGFSQSAPLKTHIRIHTGEKPYSCYACGETFATRSALTTHAFKHNGSLPYSCTRCSSTFRLKRDLVQHEQGHDDEEIRLARTGVVSEAEKTTAKEPHGHQLAPNHIQHQQNGNQISDNSCNIGRVFDESLDSPQGNAALSTLPIPASHTVGRSNPPPFHRQSLAEDGAVGSTTSQQLPSYQHNHTQDVSSTHIDLHTPNHLSAQNQSQSNLQQVPLTQLHASNIQPQIQMHSHRQY